MKEWMFVQDIPSFPYKTFFELTDQIDAGKAAFAMDITATRLICYQSRARRSICLIAWLLPLICSVFFSLFNVFFDSYIELVVIPLTILGYVIGSPYGIARNTLLLIASSSFLLVAGHFGYSKFSSILLFGLYPAWINKILTIYFKILANKTVRLSEDLFLSLYRSGDLRVYDTVSGEFHEYPPAQLIKGYNLINKPIPDSVIRLIENYRSPDEFRQQLQEIGKAKD